MLPTGEKFTSLLDLSVFHSWGNQYSNVYHSGFWSSAFAEYRPIPNLTANLKLAITFPTTSSGYSSDALVYPATPVTPFLGLTWAFQLDEETSVSMRLLDQDRVTYGAGLFLQDVETAGAQLWLKRDPFRLRGLLDGTGGYVFDGEIGSFSLDLWRDLIGVQWFLIHGITRFSLPSRWSSPTSPILYFRENFTAHYFSTFSQRRFESGLGYRAEVGGRRGTGAGLAELSYERGFESGQRLSLSVQGRYYQQDLLGPVAGLSTVEWRTPESFDKSFIDPRIIMNRDDGVAVLGGRASFEQPLGPKFSLVTDNELYAFEYQRFSPERGYFYRQALQFRPFPGRLDHLVSFFFSNKSLQTLQAGPQERAIPLPFKPEKFLGLDVYLYL